MTVSTFLKRMDEYRFKLNLVDINIRKSSLIFVTLTSFQVFIWLMPLIFSFISGQQKPSGHRRACLFGATISGSHQTSSGKDILSIESIKIRKLVKFQFLLNLQMTFYFRSGAFVFYTTTSSNLRLVSSTPTGSDVSWLTRWGSEKLFSWWRFRTFFSDIRQVR